ncbi:AAA family ATPase [Acidipropionibacterium virtanenii]|uniref:AAA family ATPase n=1 Tax=Acidipropionibacterium virtanenii TaxID=2057246 RepID=UPI001FEC64B0|nr:AAA family ATPase [Acidipropionibacterium virtanenii]
MMRGLPGSGKSTWAAARVAADPHGTAVVSRDHYRMMLHATEFPVDGIMEEEITELEADAVVRLLAQGHTVIVDDTNLPHRRVREWLGLAEGSGAQWRVEDLTGVPLETCLERNRARERRVPEEIITGWHAQFISGGRARPKVWEPIPGTVGNLP